MSDLSNLTAQALALLGTAEQGLALMQAAITSAAQGARIYAGTYAADPATRPDGTPCIAGDMYLTVGGTFKSFSAGVWSLVVGPSAADLANALDVVKGAALLGYRRDSVLKALDQLKAESASRGRMHRFWRKLRQILSGTVVQTCILSTIDSVRGYPILALQPMLNATVGIAGLALDQTGNGSAPIAAPTGDVIVPNGAGIPYDYTYWPTGVHHDIGVGGSVMFTAGGAVFTGTTFAIYYAKRAGGGAMNVDLLDSTNTVISSVTVDTANATTDFGKVQFVVPVAARKLRVTGVSGRCIVVGAKLLNTTIPGIVWAAIGRGGLALGSAGLAAAAPAIWKGCIADLQPDLATYCGREEATTVGADLTAFLTAYNVAWPNTDWVLCGVWPWGDATTNPSDYGLAMLSQPSYIENMAIKSVAEEFGHQFFDPYPIFGPGGLIRKETPNDVHLSTADSLTFGAAFAQQLGFTTQAIQRGYSDKGYASSFYQSLKLNLAGAGPNDALAGDLKAVGTQDVTLDFVRNFTLVGNYAAAPVNLLYAQGTATVPGLIFRSHYNVNSVRNVSNFAADGEWAVAFDGAAKRMYLRARLGGVLYEVPLTMMDPGKDGTGNIDSSKGRGMPVRLFVSSDTGFTTSAEYGPDDLRFGRIASTGELAFSYLPSTGGVLRQVVLPTNGGARRLGVELNTAAGATGVVQFNVGAGESAHRSVAATGDWTVNFRWDSATSLDSAMAVGQSVRLRHFVTQGATAYRPTAWQIDGVPVVPKWEGGLAPASGNASSVDGYEYQVIKTAAGAFSVFARASRFA